MPENVKKNGFRLHNCIILSMNPPSTTLAFISPWSRQFCLLPFAGIDQQSLKIMKIQNTPSNFFVFIVKLLIFFVKSKVYWQVHLFVNSFYSNYIFYMIFLSFFYALYRPGSAFPFWVWNFYYPVSLIDLFWQQQQNRVFLPEIAG